MSLPEEGAKAFVELIRGIAPLFRSGRNKLSPDTMECVDHLMAIPGTDRVAIMKVEDGGEVLGLKRPMYLSVFYQRNSERIRALPAYHKIEVDTDYKAKMLYLKESKKMGIPFGDLHPDDNRPKTMMYDIYKEYWTNYAEFYLLNNQSSRMYFVVLSTIEIEENPFRNHTQAIELEINRLKKLVK